MIKYFIIMIILILPISIFSQADARSTNEGIMRGSNICRGTYRNKSINPVKPMGSPYNQEIFQFANVEGITENAKMRYNLFKDEFEFLTPKSDTLILDKNEDFVKLNFIATNTKYKLVNYINTNDKFDYGYLIDIYQKDNIGLFKKDNIEFNEEKIAKTTLENNMPAKYFKVKSTYFLKTKESIFEFPSNKKKLIKLFLDKKEAIEVFVKENKIDFDKEQDLIKIVDFISIL
jgi:hypothetical protein